eukprot:RCo028235
MQAPVLPMDFIDPINSIVEGRLYLGNRYAASARDILLGLGVTHIVNAAVEQPNFFLDKFAYYSCKLRDNMTEQIDFEGPLRFIQDALALGGVVFVHCTRGVSRSAAIVIAYLMRTSGLSMREAVQQVRERRPFINPNGNFLQQLGDFEAKHSVMKSTGFSKSFM